MTWPTFTEIIIAGGIGAVGWLLLGKKAPKQSSKAPLNVKKESTAKIVGDRFRLLDEEELIYELGLAPSIALIKTNLGFSNENWKKDALPLIHNIIRFAQRLPASESHHHAGDGGLIKHTLDVAAMSLLASNAKSWPPGAKTEEIARLTAVWRFGILIAALLHDIGKTLTSLDIELYESAHSDHFILWVPDAGKMEETGRQYYRVLFPEKKTSYDVHKTLGWAFFQIIVPPHARRWMSDSDPELIKALRAYLSGAADEKHPMASLIRQADMASTARDLRSGSRQRFATAKRTPLIEIVMETLKEMLHERGAHFSIAVTAGGDIFRKSDTVYMMAKTVPDRIRDFLRQHAPEFAASVPSDNQRIFDTLLEYGAVLPSPYDEAKAITNIAVQFERGDGEVKSHQFTVLQFPLGMLYPEPPYPAEFLGELEVLQSAIKPSRSAAAIEHAENGAESEVAAISGGAPVSASVANISDFDIPPPPKARASFNPLTEKDVSKSESMTIDNLLAQNNLLPNSDSDDAPLQETALQDKSATNDSIDIHVLQTDAACAAILDSGKLPSEPVNEKPKSPVQKAIGKTAKSSLGLKNLFAEDVASPTTSQHPSTDDLDDESAAAGFDEAQRERDGRPANAPRPVAISLHANPVLAEILDEHKPVPANHKNSALAARKQELQAEGKRFLSWLADGLSDGGITVNQNDSMVHFIDRGMILVTPLVFKAYTNGFFDRNNPNCPGLRAQQGFLAVGWNERAANSAIFYAFAEDKFLFTCLLIPEQNIRFIVRPDSRPANNIDICISDKKHAPSKVGRN